MRFVGIACLNERVACLIMVSNIRLRMLQQFRRLLRLFFPDTVCIRTEMFVGFGWRLFCV